MDFTAVFSAFHLNVLYQGHETREIRFISRANLHMDAVNPVFAVRHYQPCDNKTCQLYNFVCVNIYFKFISIVSLACE